MSLCIMHLLQIAPAWKKQFSARTHPLHLKSNIRQSTYKHASTCWCRHRAWKNAFTWGRIAALPGNCRFHLIENEVFWWLLAVDGANAWHRQDTSQLPQVTNRKSSLLSSPLHQSFVCSLSSFVFSKKLPSLFHQGNCLKKSEHLSSPGSFFRSSRSQFNKSSTTWLKKIYPSLEVLKSWLNWVELCILRNFQIVKGTFLSGLEYLLGMLKSKRSQTLLHSCASGKAMALAPELKQFELKRFRIYALLMANTTKSSTKNPNSVTSQSLKPFLSRFDLLNP